MSRTFGVAALIATMHLSAAARAQAQTPLEPEPQWQVPVLHSLALMSTMRTAEVFIWPRPFADVEPARVGRRYRRAYSEAPRWDGDERAFEWDGDHWTLNVVGHGLFGSELYLSARRCFHSPGSALAFAALGSASWEYGFEANGVRPSGLDLIYTPLSGAVLGELRFWGARAARRLDSAFWQPVLSAIFDPFGELERAAGTPC